MLSEELPFRRNDAALKAAFPQFSDVLSIVVEAQTPDQAEDGAALLAADLAPRRALFRGVFYAEGDPFFRRNGLLYLSVDALQALSDRLAEAQPLLSTLREDMSLRGLSSILRQALGEDVGDEAAGPPPEVATGALANVLDKMAATVRSLAAAPAGQGRVRPLSWISLLDGGEPTAEDKRRFIVAQPVLDFASLEPANRAIAAVRRRAAALGLDEAAGVRVRMTGTPILFQDELRSVRNGMGVVGLVSVSLVIVILAFGLRSARLVTAILATLVMGLVWTAGFATLAVGELNLISVAFAVLFVGLSVDFGIHFALRYREALDAGAPSSSGPQGAMAVAARGVGGPLGLSALAAAIGFFAFLPTSYRGLSELGLISGVSMFIALFANLTVLPAILEFLPVKADGVALRAPAGERLLNLFAGHPRSVLGGALVLGLVALALTPLARFDDDPLNLRDPKSESMATLLDLMDDPRLDPYGASVLSDNLDEARDVAARLAALPEVRAAVTLADYVPDRQEDKLAIVEEISFFLTPVFQGAVPAPPPTMAERATAVRALRAALDRVDGPLRAASGRLAAALDGLVLDDQGLKALEAALLGTLPARLEALGEALEAEPVTMENLPQVIRARNLSADGRARVEIMPREDLRDARARRRFVDAVRAVAPDAAGTPITITEAGRAVVRAFSQAAVYAIVLITVLLLALLRSVRDSMLVLAPLVLAAVLSVAATVVFSIPFNFANVIVLPLLFGLGVAGGIHVVMRARNSMASKLMATSTPRAVLLSALTTIASFGALAISSHRGTSSMGVLLTIAITLTLVCTLIVLPALMSVLDGRGAPFRQGRGGAR